MNRFFLCFAELMMFFRSGCRNQRELIDHLVRAKFVTFPEVRNVLYMVDRKNYAGDLLYQGESAAVYEDTPMPIQCGQTISAPHMHAYALEEIFPYLKNSQAARVSIMDVGCGSGYLTAAFGRWVDDTNQKQPILGKPGKVFGIDVHPELVHMTRDHMQKEDGDLLDNQVVQISVGDGWKGLPDKGPFDAIHVGAAADKFPTNLMMQLRVGGVLVIPVGPDGGSQTLYKVERLAEAQEYCDKDFRKKKLLGVRYVPLVHPKT